MDPKGARTTSLCSSTTCRGCVAWCRSAQEGLISAPRRAGRRRALGKVDIPLRAADIDPKKIETVLISQFHPDHICGLLGQETPTHRCFPMRKSSAAEHKWWTDPSLIGRLPPGRRPLARRIQAVIPNWKNVVDRVVADKMLICGSHFPWPGLGKIARDGAGYALTLHTAKQPRGGTNLIQRPGKFGPRSAHERRGKDAQGRFDVLRKFSRPRSLGR
jgi:hypothetical protein